MNCCACEHANNVNHLHLPIVWTHAASLYFALETFDRLLAAAFVPQILFPHLAPGLGNGGGKYSRRHRGH